MARVLTPLDQFLERLRSQAHTPGPNYPSDKEMKCEQIPEQEGQEPPASSYPLHTHTLSPNYPPDGELECETKCESSSHFKELGWLADLDAEEALFRLWWRMLPDKNLARRRWRTTLNWYCQEKGFGPETLKALKRRVRDLWGMAKGTAL